MYDAGVLVQRGGGVAVVVKASVGYMPAGKTAVRLWRGVWEERLSG